MYLLTLVFPLLSFLIVIFFGRKIGLKGVKVFSILCSFLLSLVTVFTLFEVNLCDSSITFLLWSWFDLGFLTLNFSLQFDKIVTSMLLLISCISFFVHLYSIAYMSEDPHLIRFMAYLSLFTFFMIVLVTSANLVQLFIGWEGVGLCSYLLINFWFTRIQANKAAIKAMIVNKVGDIGVLLGMLLIWISFGTLDYSCFFPLSIFNLETSITMNLISFLLLIGVIGKSAQIGLHMWLPDAMEGPTPVSALIHAATMVTAGVFLIIRLSPFFEQTPTILLIIVFLGSLTVFFTSTISLTQNDLKKVIAYSTCSQLGYMVMICGFSQYNSGLFHLINHGFFKALLFLSAGSIIHALRDEQDIRKMGTMIIISPLTYICIFIGSISLMGLPFLTGFYSKDLILELVYGEYYFSFALWLGLLAASFTAFYSFRLIYFTFFNQPQSSLLKMKKAHEGDWSLITPLIFLLVLSIGIGFLLQHIVLKDELPIVLPNFDKFMPFYLSLTGSILALVLGFKLITWWKLGLLKYNLIVYSLMSNAWYFDTFFNYYIVKPTMSMGFKFTYKLIDSQILETIGPTQTLDNLVKGSNTLSKYHSGRISIYTFIFVIFICCFLFKF